MNAYVTGLSARDDLSLSRAEAYALSHEFDRPTLILDTDAIARQYAALAQGLGRARIHYAVKANPAPEILQTLVQAGSNFDAASRPEIQMCLDAGAQPAQISFGNTVKRPADIAWAHSVGVNLVRRRRRRRDGQDRGICAQRAGLCACDRGKLHGGLAADPQIRLRPR